MQVLIKICSLLLLAMTLIHCTGEPTVSKPEEGADDPVYWAHDAVMYEINIRQYSPEGSLKAIQQDLPRIKDLGVEILWLMPIHPIGIERRKGELGSYYSIKDYQRIDPAYGTEEDLRSFVEKAHSLGFKVMMDWVANHTSFDHPWITDHPDWYTKDSIGNITHPPTTDWTDVADLNFDDGEMRKAMIEAMKYWVKNFDIDGYRCDYAEGVPIDFWLDARAALDSIKPMFMLAEINDPEYHKAFHMTYGWEFHHITNEIGKGEKNALDVKEYYTKDTMLFPTGAYRLNFSTNHDENSWNGTVYERYGNRGADAITALVFVFRGMPLIYNGQEASLDKRLEFFKKDTIDWNDESRLPYFKSLIKLHQNNKALNDGPYEVPIKFYDTGNPDVLIMEQQKREGLVFSMFNLNDETETFTITQLPEEGYALRSIFDNSKITLKPDQQITMGAWDYFILTP